jgi:hypothetical protein
MSVFICRKYANALGTRLERFSPKGNDTWMFRCPLCGDSKKNKYKARGHIYRKKDSFYYRCFNCNVSTTFESFLKQVAPDLNNEFRYERFAEMRADRKTFEVDQVIEKMNERNERLNNLSLKNVLTPLSDLPKDHKARLYIEKRKIPQDAWKYLSYSDDFRKVVRELDPEKANKMPDNDERVVITTFGPNHEIIGVAGRSLDPNNEKKYIHIKASDKYPKLFGMDRTPFHHGALVFEGPIDALFFDNGIATCDSDLTFACRYYKDVILVYDNEPKNPYIVKGIKNAIDREFRVCIWPSDISFKDVNDMVMGGMLIQDIRRIILDNTVEGMRAQIYFNRWKKV